MRARWLCPCGVLWVTALLAASCRDEPVAPPVARADELGERPIGPPDAGASGPLALCRTDLDCPNTQRCCRAGLLGVCAPLDPGSECAAPDLVLALPPDFEPRIEQRLIDESDCLLDKCVLGGPGARRLLRFPVDVVNRGDAPAIVALPDAPGVRRVACDGGLFLDGFLRYELFDAEGARRATGVGDIGLACGLDFQAASTSPFDCELVGLEAHSYRAFPSDRDCQWVDITTLSPGEYTLRLTVNADLRLAERDSGNNVVERTVTIPDADPLAPCDGEPPEDTQLIENLECGWQVMPELTGLLCTPGEFVRLACTFCDGAYVPRVCPGLGPCSAAGAFINGSGRTTEVCSPEDMCDESGECSDFEFRCPASGVYSVLGFPTSPLLPIGTAPAAAPSRSICRLALGSRPFEFAPVPRLDDAAGTSGSRSADAGAPPP